MFDFLWSDYFLITISFFTSLVTAVMGVGGGVMLMVFMLMFYPPLTVIPVHGVVQLGSNTSRAFFLRRYVHWPFLVPFAIGVCIGSLCGAQFVLNIPQDILKIVVGVLALVFTWMPKFKRDFKMPFKIPFLGWLSSFLGMFGAGGGMIFGVAMARMNLSRQQTIATHAICMTVLHLTKVFIFGVFGFAFSQYWALMTGMLISGFIGSWVGTNILHRINNDIFYYLLKGMISLLCLKLIIWG
jgi:uncharacterized membrane protein YfcA